MPFGDGERNARVREGLDDVNKADVRQRGAKEVGPRVERGADKEATRARAPRRKAALLGPAC